MALSGLREEVSVLNEQRPRLRVCSIFTWETNACLVHWMKVTIVLASILDRPTRKGKGIPPGGGIFQHLQQRLSPGLNESVYVKAYGNV